jgi:hypothetical protein
MSGEEQTHPKSSVTIDLMKNEPSPRIAFVDRLEDGVVITFDDGRCAIYSSALLHRSLAQAKEVLDANLDGDLTE